MNDAPRKLHWSIWLSRLTLLLGIATVATALISAIGAGNGQWSKLDGVAGMRYAFFIGIAALLIGLYTVLRYLKAGARIILVALLGMILAGGYVGYIGTQISKARSLPMIHDITTDLENPPAFAVLELRKDNLKDMPGHKEPEFRGMDARERWVKMHKDAYGDVQTLILQAPVEEVFAKAEALVKQRGWEIAAVDQEEGRIEATDEVALLKFKDDVVFRIVSGEKEGETIVDIRSVSRVGLSDLGVNARRVRELLADLKVQFSSN
ncbi:DUF1499 domain-containing protein [Sphingorhabdus sp. Alg239-R122]|uniref:DUF1499 domain-containing protein n=1 Tax=Sphingorhabdus sp. Alg239-R122 TaxID=2305989 RepID=UPI0013DB524E|nr:DUF1499 domain-containing protein [Sphingorhabdus sp. Alg239-R122]